MRTPRLLLVCAFLAGGCGASAAHDDTSALHAARLQAANIKAADQAQAQEKDAELQELQSKLALSEAESRDLRRELSRANEFHRETVRIGSAPSSPSSDGDGWVASAEPRPRREDGPRPVLRLYGPSSSVSSSSSSGGGGRDVPPLVVPPAPAGVPTRLDVVPLPGASDAALTSVQPSSVPMATATIPGVPIPTVGDDVAVERYRAALAFIRDRKFGPALKTLHEFLVKYPKHPYADNALYWQGEVQYAQRQYAEALATFENVVARFPKGNKASDAMLKVALCHQHMGDAPNARLYYRRVQELYPDSVAARVASQEDRR